MDRDQTSELGNGSILPTGQQDASAVIVEREVTPEEIEASVSLALAQQKQSPESPTVVVDPEVAVQPVHATPSKQNPFWERHAAGAKDESLIKWRDLQIELNPDADISAVLDDAVKRIQAWRDTLVQTQTDPQGGWGERAAYGTQPSVNLATSRLIISRDRALRSVAPSRIGSAEGICAWARAGDSSSDLLIISADSAVLDEHSLEIRRALDEAGTPYVVIDGASLGESEAFQDLLEKCNRKSELFASGTLIINHLECIPWRPDALGQLRRYCEELRGNSSSGFWAVPAAERGSVVVHATYRAETEERVPQVITGLFKHRQVLPAGIVHGNGVVSENEKEASS